MDCGTAETLIWRNLDGEATEADRRELLAHVQDCASCRELRATASILHEDLRTALAVQPAAGAPIPRGAGPVQGRARTRVVLRLWRPMLAAAAVLAVAGPAWTWLRDGGTMPESPQVAVTPAPIPEPAPLLALEPGRVNELPAGRGRIAISMDGRISSADAAGLRLEEGACYLEVEPGRGAFEVRAGGALVRVLGTSFGVALEADGVRVSVSEGRVLVDAGLEQRVLLPGEELIATREKTLRVAGRDSSPGAAGRDDRGIWSWVPPGFGARTPATEPAAPQPPPGLPPSTPAAVPGSEPDGGGDMPPKLKKR